MANADLEKTERMRQRLLARIRARFEVVSEAVEVGSVRFGFTRVKDPNRVLDEVAEEEDRREKTSGVRKSGDELHLPYWAELWDSAHGVGAFLAGQRKLLMQRAGRPVRVLELGCGMGFAGTAALALGAQVLFADLEPAALLFARLNSLPWRERTRVRRVNWQRDELGEQFDLVIGADILYERAQWAFLEPFWRKHLAGDGAVLLGEPGRQSGDLFMDWITSRGWAMERHEQAVSSRPTPIRLLVLRRG